MKRNIYRKYMLRPIIYMTATRLMAGLIVLLAVTRLVKNGPSAQMVSGFLGALFALFTYLVYLRMDGIRIPRLKHIKARRKKDPIRFESSMADHMDDDAPVDFDDLEDDERDFVSFMSALVNAVLFIILSFII